MEIHGFTVQNWKYIIGKMPKEDAFNIRKNPIILAVADGVTRDPMTYLPGTSDLIGKIIFAVDYPRPSPASEISEKFCAEFPLTMSSFLNQTTSAINTSFNFINNKIIKKYNQQAFPKPDFITKDLAGCVAAGVAVLQNHINWGYICDSGVALFDSHGNLIEKTKSEDPHRLDKIIWEDHIIKGKSWREPEVRARIRSYYRNNPSNPNSYGVLTGQEQAMHYVRTGTYEFKPGQLVIAYTDGVSDIIFENGDIQGTVADMIKARRFKKLRKHCKRNVKHEGTLAYCLNN
ncbi:MAG: hypothetical protein ABIH72_02275 [archaeon]